jgi:hypothetical protein
VLKEHPRGYGALDQLTLSVRFMLYRSFLFMQDWYQLVIRYIITLALFVTAATISENPELYFLSGALASHMFEIDFEVRI